MKLIRTIVFTVSLVLLGAGYAVSQIAYSDGMGSQLTGNFQEYAARVDCGPVRIAALLLLVCCLVFPFLGKTSEAPDR